MNTSSNPQHTETLDTDNPSFQANSTISSPLLGHSLGGNSPAMEAAIEWLALHRDTITGAPIPAVRAKFGLSNLEAIEALRRGRALRNARAM